jgi:ubiquinone/menaquinone biosynthesis C-methylase UbiE
MDTESYREANLGAWESVSVGWEKRREWMMEATGVVGQRMVDDAAPQPGETVLELAAGTGDTGFMAAQAVGADGRLISTDISPKMLAAAERTGDKLGITNAEYRVLDMEAMDLPDDSADAVLCRWGFMFPPDKPRAFAETRRVLRDGGRLAFATWAQPDKNMWAAAAAMTLVARGHMPPPEPGAPGIFSLADPDAIRELVRGAGFESVEVAEVGFEFPYVDFDDFWTLITDLAGPLAQVVAGLDEDEREATREQVREVIDEFHDGDGYKVPALCLCTSAR